jgi:diguanylate cyclase (GGDEF)-like protein
MFLDLDNFKPLNDTQGHEAGDLLLIQVADRLIGCVREIDTVARFGGDEFILLINELDVDKALSVTQANQISQKIRIALVAPYKIPLAKAESAAELIEHKCTASIGVVIYKDHELRQDDILKYADLAMYQAKAAGRNQICFFDKNLY